MAENATLIGSVDTHKANEVIQVRVVEQKNGQKRVDARIHVDKSEEDGYVGFSKQGFRITGNAATELAALIKKAGTAASR